MSALNSATRDLDRDLQTDERFGGDLTRLDHLLIALDIDVVRPRHGHPGRLLFTDDGPHVLRRRERRWLSPGRSAFGVFEWVTLTTGLYVVERSNADWRAAGARSGKLRVLTFKHAYVSEHEASRKPEATTGKSESAQLGGEYGSVGFIHNDSVTHEAFGQGSVFYGLTAALIRAEGAKCSRYDVTFKPAPQAWSSSKTYGPVAIRHVRARTLADPVGSYVHILCDEDGPRKLDLDRKFGFSHTAVGAALARAQLSPWLLQSTSGGEPSSMP